MHDKSFRISEAKRAQQEPESGSGAKTSLARDGNVSGKKSETMFFPIYPPWPWIEKVYKLLSVASESAFINKWEVMSLRKKQRLLQALLEMCMCLKDHLNAKSVKQDEKPS
ncbi:hypothetical protein Tco_1484065 [Tanacetum coccineum]